MKIQFLLSKFAAVLALLAAALAPALGQERGKDIYGPCAGCHGEFGQGGKRGEYPRLAGQQKAHLAAQLRAFRDRSRANLPMFPYTRERELSESDIVEVSAYLAGIELPTDWPEFKPEDDALTRLTLTERVMIIPRVPGDLDHGRTLYDEECAYCHGQTGLGNGRNPRLVGQYTTYLRNQADAFIRAERPHDDKEAGKGILGTLKAQDLQDVWAHLTLIQAPAKP